MPPVMIADEDALVLPGMRAVIEPARALFGAALRFHHMSNGVMRPGVIEGDFCGVKTSFLRLAQAMVLFQRKGRHAVRVGRVFMDQHGALAKAQ